MKTMKRTLSTLRDVNKDEITIQEFFDFSGINAENKRQAQKLGHDWIKVEVTPASYAASLLSCFAFSR